MAFWPRRVGKAPGMETERPYSDEDVDRLRGSLQVEHTLARRGAERLRQGLAGERPVRALGASRETRPCSRSRPG